MSKKNKKGWPNEPTRHGLASKGIMTNTPSVKGFLSKARMSEKRKNQVMELMMDEASLALQDARNDLQEGEMMEIEESLKYIQSNIDKLHRTGFVSEDDWMEVKYHIQSIIGELRYDDESSVCEEDLNELEEMLRTINEKHQKKASGEGIFHDPKYKKYKSMVSMESADQAKESVERMQDDWNDAETTPHKNRLIRVANESANRAKIIKDRDDVSDEVEDKFDEIHDIYRGFVEQHKGES